MTLNDERGEMKGTSRDTALREHSYKTGSRVGGAGLPSPLRHQPHPLVCVPPPVVPHSRGCMLSTRHLGLSSGGVSSVVREPGYLKMWVNKHGIHARKRYGRYKGCGL